MTDRFDPLTFGKRLRHRRRAAGLTLRQLGDRVGHQAPYLSMLEGGLREPRLSLVDALADALATTAADLLRSEAPDHRSRLEIGLERAQQDPVYGDLGLPHLKATATLPDAAIEHLLALYGELKRARAPVNPGVEEARRANASLRAEMRGRDNYFEEIERAAAEALGAVHHPGSGAVPESTLLDLAGHFGFTIRRVQDVPPSTRSITDLENRRIYIGQRDALRTREARSVVVQTLGHFALGHAEPTHFADFLRQRVEANYFAGAVLVPEPGAVATMLSAKRARDLSVEDLKELFYVSYEMAAHRFTNLATRHLEIPVHFVRSDPDGLIWKAYENNAVPFPVAADGGIEGERLCREWGTRRASAASTGTPSTISTPTRRRGPSGAAPTWRPIAIPLMPSPSASASRRPATSGAGTPTATASRAVPVAIAAALPAPISPRAGMGWPTRRRQRTVTCRLRCPVGRSPVWTWLRCTNSWTGTPPDRTSFHRTYVRCTVARPWQR